MSGEEVERRRSEACKAFWYTAAGAMSPTPVETAIKSATRVRITPEVLDMMPRGSVTLDDMMRVNVLRAVFLAAGFEVVE